MSFRTAIVAFALALAAATGACGRRGPPLAPLQVDPETPQLFPLRQEAEQVVIRWLAPRLSSDGSAADLRLRKAVVSYRVVDILRLAAEERASRRADAAGEAEEEIEASLPEGEVPDEMPGPAPPEEAASEPDAPADEPPVAEPAAPESETGSAQVSAPDPPPDSETPRGPDSAEPVPPPPEVPEAGDPQEEPEEPEAGEPPAEESAEPPADPEPTGTLLDYDDLEFEVLSEVDSETRGEERTLELPVESDWVGRRLEIRVRYEARGGASEESELQSLDITGPLPVVEDVQLEVGPRAVTVRWRDSRPDLQEAMPLADPSFEVFRRRGGQQDRVGRAVGPTLTDSDLVWGEEVCYSARLVVAGGDEERVLPDPGPEVASAEPEAVEGERAVPEEAGDSGPRTAPAPDPVAAGEGTTTPASEPPPWTPIPIRVPGAGSAALSVGPASDEVCLVPVDTFPPTPPSDLRLFWQAARTDLSWRESVSTDVVGYHVYRSGPDGDGFARLTLEPVEETVFGDADRDSRGNYRYAVTAVDAADPPNESLPSDSRQVTPR